MELPALKIASSKSVFRVERGNRVERRFMGLSSVALLHAANGPRCAPSQTVREGMLNFESQDYQAKHSCTYQQHRTQNQRVRFKSSRWIIFFAIGALYRLLLAAATPPPPQGWAWGCAPCSSSRAWTCSPTCACSSSCPWCRLETHSRLEIPLSSKQMDLSSERANPLST